MGCGRPVLILPFAPKRAFGFGDAMVAWNASREAARAAFEALPLLRASSSVRVVAVDPQADPKMRGAIAGADMAEALARHGVKAVAEPYYGGGAEAGRALLQHAREMDASLLVLGGYGHSRLREWILGGATRDVLASLEVPVLMSH
jgi:nucleotide-binding universal stress UspA family protein